jgi:hypothetical protein
LIKISGGVNPWSVISKRKAEAIVPFHLGEGATRPPKANLKRDAFTLALSEILKGLMAKKEETLAKMDEKPG